MSAPTTMEQEQALGRLKALAAQVVQVAKGSADGSQQLRQLTSEGLLQIMAIKEAARAVCASAERSKEASTAAKLSLEGSDSTLQNLLYEKGYYEKEIHTCRSFVSKHKDEAVALMPVDEFMASLTESPEDQQLKAAASANEHELMKARLVHEDRVRKALIKQLDELKHLRQTLHDQVNQKQRVLADLQNQLRNVEGTAKPLQQVLSPLLPLRASMSRGAELLPTPLYIAYSQLVAAREALHLGCNMSIQGSLDEAEAHARAALEGGDDTQPLQQLLRSASGASPEAAYKPHPLSVELQVLREPGAVPAKGSTLRPPAPLISVTLQYLPVLRVVTAHCANPEDNALLKGLFPGDDGSGLPLEAVQQLQGGSFRFSSSLPARPYRWCQHICGLDFVPALPQLAVQLSGGEQEVVAAGLDAYRRQQRVPTLVGRLRQVKLGEASLK